MEGNNEKLFAFFVGGHKVVINVIGEILLKLNCGACKIVPLESFNEKFLKEYVSGYQIKKSVVFLDSVLTQEFRELRDDHFLKLLIDHVVVIWLTLP